MRVKHAPERAIIQRHMTDDAIFPRNFLKAYPVALRGEGCFVYAVGGKRYLDASGGAAVVTLYEKVGR